MLIYWIWFACLSELNGRQKLWLLERFRSPEDVYQMDRHSLRSLELPAKAALSLLNKELDQAHRILQGCMEKGIGILAFSDSAYPDRLRSIDDPPMVLYYMGRLPAWELQPTVGVVGTRKASPYGLRAAASISSQIAACGGLVISGGARGIDAMASQGALNAGKQTVVVQAGGLDSLYPKSNMSLFERVLETGCILSEYPPGTPPYRGNFLRRNRLISGLSNAVLVVEAPGSSGSLNTARWALEQGRDVFVVPGNIDVESCAGSNALIGDIAQAALDGWSVIKEYAQQYPATVCKAQVATQTGEISPEKPAPKAKADKITVDKWPNCPYSVKDKNCPDLTEQEKRVVAVLTAEPVPVDQVTDRLGTSPAAVMAILTKLSVKGVVKLHPGKYVSLL